MSLGWEHRFLSSRQDLREHFFRGYRLAMSPGEFTILLVHTSSSKYMAMANYIKKKEVPGAMRKGSVNSLCVWFLGPFSARAARESVTTLTDSDIVLPICINHFRSWTTDSWTPVLTSIHLSKKILFDPIISHLSNTIV